jgi:hypothetical protein
MSTFFTTAEIERLVFDRQDADFEGEKVKDLLKPEHNQIS